MTATRVSRVMHASRDAIYAACIDPEKLVRWRVPDGMRAFIHEFDAREGGRYRMSLVYADPRSGPGGKTTQDTDSFTGTFVKLVSNERIVERIVFDTGDDRYSGVMTMTISFRDADGGTEVTILTENLPPGIRPEDNRLGCEMSLKNLARLVE